MPKRRTAEAALPGMPYNFVRLSVANATDSLTRIYGVPGKTASAIRRVGMGLVGRISPIRNRLMNEARGTSGELPLLLRGLPI